MIEITPNDVMELSFSDDIETPNKWKDKNGEWHEGRIPLAEETPLNYEENKQ